MRPRISFSPGLQFEDVVAFVPPVYTRYTKGIRGEPVGRKRGSEEGREGEKEREEENREYLHTQSTRSLAHADIVYMYVLYVPTWAPTRPSAFLPRTLGVVLPFSSSTPRLTCPISPHWPRECEHVEARFESRGREAQVHDMNSKSGRAHSSIRGAGVSILVYIAFATLKADDLTVRGSDVDKTCSFKK